MTYDPYQPGEMDKALFGVQAGIDTAASITSAAANKVSDYSKQIAGLNIDYLKQSTLAANAILAPFNAVGYNSGSYLNSLLGANGEQAQQQTMGYLNNSIQKIIQPLQHQALATGNMQAMTAINSVYGGSIFSQNPAQMKADAERIKQQSLGQIEDYRKQQQAGIAQAPAFNNPYTKQLEGIKDKTSQWNSATPQQRVEFAQQLFDTARNTQAQREEWHRQNPGRGNQIEDINAPNVMEAGRFFQQAQTSLQQYNQQSQLDGTQPIKGQMSSGEMSALSTRLAAYDRAQRDPGQHNENPYVTAARQNGTNGTEIAGQVQADRARLQAAQQAAQQMEGLRRKGPQVSGGLGRNSNPYAEQQSQIQGQFDRAQAQDQSQQQTQQQQLAAYLSGQTSSVNSTYDQAMVAANNLQAQQNGQPSSVNAPNMMDDKQRAIHPGKSQPISIEEKILSEKLAAYDRFKTETGMHIKNPYVTSKRPSADKERLEDEQAQADRVRLQAMQQRRQPQLAASMAGQTSSTTPTYVQTSSPTPTYAQTSSTTPTYVQTSSPTPTHFQTSSVNPPQIQAGDNELLASNSVLDRVRGSFGSYLASGNVQQQPLFSPYGNIDNSASANSQYAGDVINSLVDPTNNVVNNYLNNSFLNPSINAMNRLGTEAIMSNAGAKGMLGSGQVLQDIYNSGQGIAGQYIIPGIQQLSGQVLQGGMQTAGNRLSANTALQQQQAGIQGQQLMQNVDVNAQLMSQRGSLSSGMLNQAAGLQAGQSFNFANMMSGQSTGMYGQQSAQQQSGMANLFGVGAQGQSQMAQQSYGLGGQVAAQNQWSADTVNNSTLAVANAQANAELQKRQLQYMGTQQGFNKQSSAPWASMAGAGLGMAMMAAGGGI